MSVILLWRNLCARQHYAFNFLFKKLSECEKVNENPVIPPTKENKNMPVKKNVCLVSFPATYSLFLRCFFPDLTPCFFLTDEYLMIGDYILFIYFFSHGGFTKLKSIRRVEK